MNAACIDPAARICLLRHIHAVRKGLTAKPCHGCEPAIEAVALLRRSDPPRDIPRAKPVPASVVAQPEPPAPAPGPGGLDLSTLREVLRHILNKQAVSGQKSVYLDRIQTLYNTVALKGDRIQGKRRWRAAVEGVEGLTLHGSYLLLDRGAWGFCMGQGTV